MYDEVFYYCLLFPGLNNKELFTDKNKKNFLYQVSLTVDHSHGVHYGEGIKIVDFWLKQSQFFS